MLFKNFKHVIVACCLLLIVLIKFVVRPYVHVPAELQLLVDTAPNLLAAFGLPLAFAGLLKRYGVVTLTNMKRVYLLSLLFIIINECFQLIRFFGRTFDYFDIAASFVGTGISYVVYVRLLFRISPANEIQR